jgi:formyl-CoA transferase
MLKDPHFLARGLFEDCTLPDGTTVKLPAIAPKMSETPGGTDWIGPPLGAHNREVLSSMLGLSEQELQALAAEGVITAPEPPASL